MKEQTPLLTGLGEEDEGDPETIAVRESAFRERALALFVDGQGEDRELVERFVDGTLGLLQAATGTLEHPDSEYGKCLRDYVDPLVMSDDELREQFEAVRDNPDALAPPEPCLPTPEGIARAKSLAEPVSPELAKKTVELVMRDMHGRSAWLAAAYTPSMN